MILTSDSWLIISISASKIFYKIVLGCSTVFTQPWQLQHLLIHLEGLLTANVTTNYTFVSETTKTWVVNNCFFSGNCASYDAQQQYLPERCRTAMYWWDLGLEEDPFYKVEWGGWCSFESEVLFSGSTPMFTSAFQNWYSPFPPPLHFQLKAHSPSL